MANNKEFYLEYNLKFNPNYDENVLISCIIQVFNPAEVYE